MNPKTFAELVQAISGILPQASIDADFDGQIVIYTNLKEVEEDRALVLKEFDSQ